LGWATVSGWTVGPKRLGSGRAGSWAALSTVFDEGCMGVGVPRIAGAGGCGVDGVWGGVGDAAAVSWSGGGA
jgi:hypothetical protein